MTNTVTTPADPNLANDTASSIVTGSTIPGLPNNGVPPVVAAWPVVPGLIFIGLIGAFAARRRRLVRKQQN